MDVQAEMVRERFVSLSNIFGEAITPFFLIRL